MTYIDLIQRAGDRIKTQGLARSVTNVSQNKKGVGKITFETEAQMASGLMEQTVLGKTPEYVGVVIWIPSDCFESLKGGAE